jgi:hypothetical protein
VIGAVLITGARAPLLVKRQHLKTMKPGSVLVDVAVDQGGCIEVPSLFLTVDGILIQIVCVVGKARDRSVVCVPLRIHLFDGELLPLTAECGRTDVQAHDSRRPDVCCGRCAPLLRGQHARGRALHVDDGSS